MKTKARRQLTTKLEIGGKPTAEIVLQNFLDRIAAKRQLHQLRQHLKASQGFLDRAIRSDQAQAVDNVAFGAEAAHRRQNLSVTYGRNRNEGVAVFVLDLVGDVSPARSWQ